MKTFVNAKELLEKGFVDLRQYINYDSPASFLNRGDSEKLKALISTGLFELDGVFIKKIGFEIPQHLKEGGAMVSEISEPQKQIEQAITQQDTLTQEQEEKFKKQIKELELQLTEANNTIKKQSKWMDDNDKEFFALEKELKELKAKMEQNSGKSNGSDETWTIDGVEMSMEDIVCGYTAKCRLVEEKENNIKKLETNMDAQIQKQVGEIMKKNEYLQEDLEKALKQVNEYKQEAFNTSKYYLKFKVGYEMMIENGAKEPDKILVDKEVKKLLKTREELQGNEKDTTEADI